MGPAIYHVNALCGREAAGSPGAVCLLDDSHSTEWMQEVTAQMNLTETGFVQRLDTGDFALRWFSPRQEMPLCGHVTLGAAHVIWVEAQLSDQAVLRFETASGALHASRGADGIEIALPINLCTNVTPPTWFRDLFAVEPKRTCGGPQVSHRTRLGGGSSRCPPQLRSAPASCRSRRHLDGAICIFGPRHRVAILRQLRPRRRGSRNRFRSRLSCPLLEGAARQARDPGLAGLRVRRQPYRTLHRRRGPSHWAGPHRAGR